MAWIAAATAVMTAIARNRVSARGVAEVFGDVFELATRPA